MENTNPVNNKRNKESEAQEKMRMTDRFITAMFLPNEYGKLLKLKMGKVVNYFLVLLLLISVIQYVIPVLGAIAGMGGLKNIILNEIPEFSLKDGTFAFDGKIEQENVETGVYFLVDTSVDKYTEEDIPADVVQAILISRTNILVYNNVSGLGGMVQEESFEHYKEFTITNQTVADASIIIYISMFFSFMILYMLTFIRYLFSGLFYAVVMYLLTKTMLSNTEFGTVYKVALFAKSTGAIVIAVTYCINSALFVLAGSAFNMLLTVIIINKALIQMERKSVL